MGRACSLAPTLPISPWHFILSLNDRSDVREVVSGFQIAGVETHYGLPGLGDQPAGEVIITGP